MSTTNNRPGPIPVLLYHCVGSQPSTWIAPFAVSAATLSRHLEILAASGRTAITVSGLRNGMAGTGALPERPVVVTFDDGFADTLTVAAPLLGRAGIRATVYVTSGFVAGRSPGGDRMLDWAQTGELAAQGHEIGAHSVSHPQLDTLAPAAARREIETCKHRLQDALGTGVRSFAYPHGYSSPGVRRLVAEAGYESACSVKNALAAPGQSVYTVARLMLTSRTSDQTLRRWLAGSGTRVGQPDERPATRAWRTYRRARLSLTGLRNPT